MYYRLVLCVICLAFIYIPRSCLAISLHLDNKESFKLDFESEYDQMRVFPVVGFIPVGRVNLGSKICRSDYWGLLQRGSMTSPQSYLSTDCLIDVSGIRTHRFDVFSHEKIFKIRGMKTVGCPQGLDSVLWGQKKQVITIGDRIFVLFQNHAVYEFDLDFNNGERLRKIEDEKLIVLQN